jgi:hypothetical protein
MRKSSTIDGYRDGNGSAAAFPPDRRKKREPYGSCVS